MEKYIVKLTNEERVDLISLISKGKASAKKLTHARILLAIDGSNNGIQTDASVAEPLHISERTVRRVARNVLKMVSGVLWKGNYIQRQGLKKYKVQKKLAYLHYVVQTHLMAGLAGR